MVLASHVIFSAYGFWLPNDPRGSWSDWVGSWELFRYGPATKAEERRSVANTGHDHQKRMAAKLALKRPPVLFNGLQARAIGRGFADYCRNAGLSIWACAILPDHAHLVIARHRLKVESLVNQLKGNATAQLQGEGIHPFQTPFGRPDKCFSVGLWKVFLDSPDDVFRSIGYVKRNPEKEGLRPQRWTFVTPYAG